LEKQDRPAPRRGVTSENQTSARFKRAREENTPGWKQQWLEPERFDLVNKRGGWEIASARARRMVLERLVILSTTAVLESLVNTWGGCYTDFRPTPAVRFVVLWNISGENFVR